jgi:hypothetical protein
MQALGHTSAALSLEVYSRVVAGSTKGLGESMARLVCGPDWARMGTNEAATPNGQNGAVVLEIKEKST